MIIPYPTPFALLGNLRFTDVGAICDGGKLLFVFPMFFVRFNTFFSFHFLFSHLCFFAPFPSVLAFLPLYVCAVLFFPKSPPPAVPSQTTTG